MLELHQLMVEVAEAATAGDGFLENAASAHLIDFLAEMTDGHLLRHCYDAVVRRLLAGDHAEQGGLARAIRTDEPRLLTGVELKRGVYEEHLPPVLLADIGKRDHGEGDNREDS